jgi:hypothetical protein
MTREDAQALYDEIESQCSERGDELCPTFNVRLDAGTTRETCTRFYKLFVRVDGAEKPDAVRDHLHWVLERARERGVTATLENAGIELS